MFEENDIVAEPEKAYDIKRRAYAFSKEIVTYVGEVKIDKLYFFDF